MKKQSVIWITGASSGIGSEMAQRLALLGHRVIVTARNVEALNDLCTKNKNITSEPADIGNKESLQRIAASINNKFGCIDKVIINAGSCEYFDIDTPDWDMMRRVMDVNYFGAINTVEAALPLLRKSALSEYKKEGEAENPHIIVVASLASVVPFPRSQAYGASKAALTYFFESLRIDLAKENIDITIIQPGFIKTPLTAKNDFPMPFLMESDVAASIIVDKISSHPKLIQFPKRLSWLLSSFRVFPSVWFWLATNKLSRG